MISELGRVVFFQIALYDTQGYLHKVEILRVINSEDKLSTNNAEQTHTINI